MLHRRSLEIRLFHKDEIRTALLHSIEQIRLCRQKKFKDNGNEYIRNKALTHRNGTL
jgi:hypothetical protein